LFVDGHPGREQVVGGHLKIQFVGDEFHTVYRVREPGKGKLPGRFHIVLDGVEGKSYDDILGKTPFYGGPPQWAHFSAEGEVRFVARSGRKFIHVTQSRSPMSP
jgi:hypothetical protein